MKRMAKLLALVLSVLMVLTMVGCSTTTDTGSTDTGSTSTGSTSTGSTSTGSTSTSTSTGSTSTETAAPAELTYWR
ncbi:MAG: hypothetical protein E7334_10610, partial [Clostridiales bacterium]|nr:hypothetical protein [Clostridiales bacterium]